MPRSPDGDEASNTAAPRAVPGDPWFGHESKLGEQP
jgi:hypothetical protein